MTSLSLTIPHSKPTLGPEEVQALSAVVQSGQLSLGPRVAEFERGVAAFIGVEGGVAVSSGTAALQLVLLGLGVGPGDEVILPSYVCVAPWLATVRVGARPRVVDIEPASYAIDPGRAEKVVSSRTKVIIVPHPFGLPADLTRLQALGVPLVEDCAQTLGAVEAGRQVGSVGVAAICSFYATKLLCTGEGGMVVSRDTALLEKCRHYRLYDEELALVSEAFNYKMTDLQAALGLSQLSRFRSFLERRASIAAAYQAAFAQTGLTLPLAPEGRSHIFYRYVVRLGRTGRRRRSLEGILGRLEHRGIQCRRPVFRPLHRYLDLDSYPESEQAMETALSVPIYPTMTDDEVTRTIRTLCEELT